MTPLWGKFRPGQEHDIPDKWAQKLIDLSHAEKVE